MSICHECEFDHQADVLKALRTQERIRTLRRALLITCGRDKAKVFEAIQLAEDEIFPLAAGDMNGWKKTEHEAKVRRILKLGDTVTHTRCMGCVEEHIYIGNDGYWLCGKPTKDTVRLGNSKYEVNDIYPCNVTHINRVPVEVVELLAETKRPNLEYETEGARG